jgi:hypothetical protein
MRSRKRSLTDYLAAEMPVALQWFNRPSDHDEGNAWMTHRAAWARLHRVDLLDLIRHDAAAKRADAGLPPRPIPSQSPTNHEGVESS